MEVRFGNAADIDQWINLVRRVSWNFPGLETEKDLEEHRQTVLKFIEKRQANQVFVLYKDTTQMTKEEKAKRETVERWGCFELSVAGKQDGNPFTDYTIHGQFRGEHETVSADGFYDGDGIYKIRFMPSFSGIYHYEIDGTFGMPQSGTIEVTEAAEGNHGPVRVTDTFYFSYAGGTPFYPLGTTCYVWELQTSVLSF